MKSILITSMKKPLLVVLALALTGCGANIDDLIVYTQQIRANTQVNIKPYPEFQAQPSVSYQASTKRSPFLRSIKSETIAAEQQKADCKKINVNRRKQALENYGLDGLAMSGVFTTNGRKYALISANDGTLHKVSWGSYVGLFNGRVTQIKNNEILITEMLPDGAGCFKSKDATLTLSSMVGENNDV